MTKTPMYCPGYPTLAKALGFLEKHKVLEVFFKTRQLEIKSLHGRFMAQVNKCVKNGLKKKWEDIV